VADTPHAYLMKHASERPKSIAQTNPAAVASPELEALIFRALEKDRNKRYAAAREFAQELEKLIPTLPDTGGAPPPLPAIAEITAANDAHTVVSVEQSAPTVATERPRAAVGKTLDRVHVDDAERNAGFSPLPEGPPEPRRSSWPLYAVAVVLALVAAATWMLMRPRPEPEGPAAQTTVPIIASTMTTITTVPPSIPIEQGHLGINAFPWAEVTSVKNLDDGQTVDIGPNVVTPAPLDLAPGRYEVTLTNPKFAKPITRTVSVQAGADETLYVNFGDPASASVPDFGVAQ
jgi:hypothetical protein